MKGQKINVENISKKINEEMDNVKSKLSSDGKTEGSQSVNKLIAGLGEFFSFIASFLRVALGVLFLMLGIGMLIGFVIAIGGFSSGIPGNPELSIRFLEDYIFFNPHMLSLAIIAAILLLVAPFLYFIYLGCSVASAHPTACKRCGHYSPRYVYSWKYSGLYCSHQSSQGIQ